MTSDTLFLQPLAALPSEHPLFVNAVGEIGFNNVSLPALSTSTDAITHTIVIEGNTIADANAYAVDFQDPAFSLLETDASGLGEAGNFQGEAVGEASAISTFWVEAHQEFSFDFSIFVELLAKEIEQTDREYAIAEAHAAFVILDISDPNAPIWIDEFTAVGTLESSEGIAQLHHTASSDNITITGLFQTSDIGLDNGIDQTGGVLAGTYRHELQTDTQIAVVKINSSATNFFGDYLIGNLGEDIRYGTIYSDILRGTSASDKIYASNGDDKLFGKNGHDILEGGRGNDTLRGGNGHDKIFGSYDNDRLYGASGKDLLAGGMGKDKIYGGSGNDIIDGGQGNDLINGGQGSDLLTGGEGSDVFQFSGRRNRRRIKLERDQITDFEIGTDKIALSKRIFIQLSGSVGDTIVTNDFATVTSNADIASSKAKIVFNSNTGDLFYNSRGFGPGQRNGGPFASLHGGSSVSQLSASDFFIMA